MEYHFRLSYQLSADTQDIDAVIEQLAEAGCDDALIGSGRPGHLALEFMRDAVSAKAAVQSAIVELFFEAASVAEIQQRLHDEVYITRLEVAVG